MQNIINNVKSSGLKVLETLTPVLKESKFQETGVLTPEEFVAAGDHLVHHCPSWQWASGDEASIRDYLPKDKQFLITRNVPCYKRCRQMDDYAQEQEKVLGLDEDLEEGDGGWVDTHHYADKSAPSIDTNEDATSNAISEMTLGDEQIKPSTSDAVDDSDDGDAVDMEDFIESGMLDEAALDIASTKLSDDKASDTAGVSTIGEILSTRTYDLNICYDKYYQTPRLFLFGYNEQRKALSVDEMYEDFSADHANKTITMETHPHLPGPPQASVHPCRHAQVMKKLIDQIVEGGKELGVHIMEQFRLIQSSRMLSSVSTDLALSWSDDHQLAVLTSKGVYIMDIVPNATNTSTNLNIEPMFLTNDRQSNPWQKDIDIKISDDERVIDGMKTTTLLDNAIHVGSTGNDENEILKQISCAKWTNSILGNFQASIVTLTHGNRLRVYCRIQEKWQCVIDVSEVLNKYLKSKKWMDSYSTPRKRPYFDETQENIIIRSFSMATTTFVWSDGVLHENGDNFSNLITAQKNGTLILWTVHSKSGAIDPLLPFEKDFINMEVLKMCRAQIGMISSLNLFYLDCGNSLLIAGAHDGRLKVFILRQNKRGSTQDADLLDCGLAWKDTDRLSVRDVLLMSFSSVKQNQQYDIRLAVVKASYLILMRLNVTYNKKLSVDVVEHIAFGTGPSSIVSVECMQINELDSKFIVACREGPFHLLSVPAKDLSSATLSLIDAADFFAKSSDGASLDTKNYRCHGFKKSKGSCIWVFLQNGLLDEQVKFTKGKLMFLTQNSFSSISKTVIENCDKISGYIIPKSKDSLEIFRILACAELKVKGNKDSVSEMFQNLIQKDIALSREKRTLRLEKMQLYLWICQLFATISNSDEIILSWDAMAEDLHRDVLCLHAQKILSMFVSSDPNLRSDIYDIDSISSIHSFYVNFGKSNRDELHKLNMPKYVWKCKFCNSNEDLQTNEDFYLDCFYCAENHHWPRCVLTLKLCDDKNLLKCKWCESVTLNGNLKNYRNLNCSLCHGPFMSS